MKHKQYILILMMLVGWICAASYAEQATNPKTVTIRTVPSQTVLYTVVRGTYDKLGLAFGMLYGLAGVNGLTPTGPAMSVHLNNPKNVDSDHWLTEIRIPVDNTALELAGTLGVMTDVKTVPETLTAVGLKPKGVSDSDPIFERVYKWIYKNGYASTDASMQIVRSDSETHDYSQMEVEIVVPVVRMATDAD